MYLSGVGNRPVRGVIPDRLAQMGQNQIPVSHADSNRFVVSECFSDRFTKVAARKMAVPSEEDRWAGNAIRL